jgi:hypothetical protein
MESEPFDDIWITRGAFEVNLARRLVQHGGCSFRILHEPACALLVDADGAPPLDGIPLMQSRAWVVFYLTEKMITQLREITRRRAKD